MGWCCLKLACELAPPTPTARGPAVEQRAEWLSGHTAAAQERAQRRPGAADGQWLRSRWARSCAAAVSGSLILVAVGFLEVAVREVSERVCRLAIQRATGLD